MNEAVRELLGNALAAVQPVRESLAKIEAEIEVREEELKSLRQARSQVTKVLALLDPAWPNTEPRRQKKSSGSSNISDKEVERILGHIRDMNGHSDGPFNARELSDLIGTHQTTIHKA